MNAPDSQTPAWVTCLHCGKAQSPHERWPVCAYCGRTQSLGALLAEALGCEHIVLTELVDPSRTLPGQAAEPEGL